MTQRSSPLDQLKIKYNKAWLNTNVAKTLASHAGVFIGARFSSFPTNGVCGEGRKTNSPKNACVGGYQNTDWETYCFNSWEFHLHLHSYSSLAKTWLSIRNRISPGVTPYLGSECSFVFFLNRLTANERASISRAVLEMEANAVLYIQKHISAPLLAAVRELSPRSFSSWGGPRERRK